jgi:hypothetical protein
MKQSEATMLVAGLAASFPRQALGERTVEVYVEALLDLDAALATQAVRTIQQTSRFFPAISEIREMVATLQLGAPEPMFAWEQARTKGADRHELVRRARRIVGDDFDWQQTPTGILQKRFLDAYAEVKDAAMKEIAAPALGAASGLRPAEAPLAIER